MQPPYQLVITGLVGNSTSILSSSICAISTLPVGYYWISWKRQRHPYLENFSVPYQLVITGLVGNGPTVGLPRYVHQPYQLVITGLVGNSSIFLPSLTAF